MAALCSYCIFILLVWWPRPQQKWWTWGWTLIGSIVVILFWRGWLPIAVVVCGACLWIWLEILHVILVRRFQNIGQVNAFNGKVFVLEVINLVAVLPCQLVLTLAHNQLAIFVWQILLVALVINSLCTVGLALFWLLTLLLPYVRHHFMMVKAIVVLGAGLHDGKVPPILARRLQTASELWRSHPATVIVVTGARLRGDQLSEAAAMATYLRDQCKVPTANIRLEERAKNTWQNLKYSQHLLQEARINDPTTVAVVTSSFHLLRAFQYGRRQKLHWHFIAAPTPLSHQPMAVTRDFLGIIRDHYSKALVLVAIVLLVVEIF